MSLLCDDLDREEVGIVQKLKLTVDDRQHCARREAVVCAHVWFVLCSLGAEYEYCVSTEPTLISIKKIFTFLKEFPAFLVFRILPLAL